MGARLNGPTNLYSSNFYADLDTANNLYVYEWLNNNGSNFATQLGSVAVGAVNLNTWYKLSMAVHSTAIDVSVNGVPWEHTTDAQFPSGGVAIFGGENMVAHFSYVRSRRYAATIPTTTVGAVTTNGISAASVTLNPNIVVGGASSQGTVTLSGPAPSGGATGHSEQQQHGSGAGSGQRSCTSRRDECYVYDYNLFGFFPHQFHDICELRRDDSDCFPNGRAWNSDSGIGDVESGQRGRRWQFAGHGDVEWARAQWWGYGHSHQFQHRSGAGSG